MNDEGTRRGVSHFALNLLRIGAGLLFMQHGVQKLFGWLDGRQVAELVSQRGLAGVLEVFGGALIVMGVLTRPVALILAIEMLWAYLQAHLPRGFWPILNGGELALLYFLIWTFIAANGGGAFSVDGWWKARRRDRIGE